MCRMSYARVRQWLIDNTSLEPGLLEGAGFAAAIAERIALSGGDAAKYLDALKHNVVEVERLVSEVAVPETWLFRYARSFEFLFNHLVRLRIRGDCRLSMCSVGCAMGQEPYSMAITALHAGWTPDTATITALDINSDFLRRADGARYGLSSIRSELPKWSLPYLVQGHESVVIGDDARAIVDFRHGDVITVGLDGRYNVIFCRNLLIYLRSSARDRLMKSIVKALVPGGVLCVGHTDHFNRSEYGLQAVESAHTFAYELAREKTNVNMVQGRPDISQEPGA
jgi:chemotaxis protein methyltransferase WspC